MAGKLIDCNDPEERGEFFDPFFANVDKNIDFLKTLHQEERRDEACILCVCYIDWMSKCLYGKKEGTNAYNFVKILREHGGDPLISRINGKFLIDQFTKSLARRLENVHPIVSEIIQGHPVELIDENELIKLIRGRVASDDLKKLKKELWRGTLAAFIYYYFRIAAVHGIGCKGGYTFERSTYNGHPVPEINFITLHNCLVNIFKHVKTQPELVCNNLID